MIELEIICRTVCEAFGADIKTHSREEIYFIGRSAFYHYAKKCTKYSLSQIGIFVGVTHHATVIHGLRRFNVYQVRHLKFKGSFERLRIEMVPIVQELAGIETDWRNNSELQYEILNRKYVAEQSKTKNLEYKYSRIKNRIPKEMFEMIKLFNDDEIQEFIDLKLTPHMRAYKYYQDKYKQL